VTTAARWWRDEAELDPELLEGEGGGLLDAVALGILRGRIAAGARDENVLTNDVFFTRHPELPRAPLKPGQESLMAEWRNVRDTLVRPALRAAGVGSATSAGSSAGAKAGDADVRRALRIGATPVAGLGITLRELLERYRAQDAAHVPMEVLLAFINYEAGTNLFNDATAGKWSDSAKTYSPSFYELGIFQTPAGEHGRGAQGSAPAFPAPGRGVEASTLGKGWYRLKKSYPTPQTWKDPVMQVRVGLWDLTSTAERVAKLYPDLFPDRRSEWFLRMAVLYSFSRGAGAASAFLSVYRQALRALPENRRWDFLRGKSATNAQGRRFVFLPENVDKKMALAAKLRGGATATPTAPPPPSSSRPPTPPSGGAPASGVYDGSSPAPGTAETRRSFPTNPPVRGNAANRSKALYDNILNQFAANKNPRYAHRNGSTFCNIFVWDVTRAMAAEVPHWVDRNGDPGKVGKPNQELNANQLNDWFHKHGARHGWSQVTLAVGIQRANQGYPVVASWKNKKVPAPGKRAIGHIAMIRPGLPSAEGAPWMAQAGAKNRNYIRMFGAGGVWAKTTPVEVWTHD